MANRKKSPKLTKSFGIIKHYYREIISYGLIIAGILFLILSLIIRPQEIRGQEIYDYSKSPVLTEISFPYSLEISVQNPKSKYIEIHFGDDSINEYTYTITARKDSESFFEHTYINELSNIVRVPLPENQLQPNDIVTINIVCQDSCNNVNFKLFETEVGKTPKLLIGVSKTNLYFFWFAWFVILIGLTLLPFTQRSNNK